jgi:hypothetical protein
MATTEEIIAEIKTMKMQIVKLQTEVNELKVWRINHDN